MMNLKELPSCPQLHIHNGTQSHDEVKGTTQVLSNASWIRGLPEALRAQLSSLYIMAFVVLNIDCSASESFPESGAQIWT